MLYVRQKLRTEVTCDGHGSSSVWRFSVHKLINDNKDNKGMGSIVQTFQELNIGIN